MIVIIIMRIKVEPWLTITHKRQSKTTPNIESYSHRGTLNKIGFPWYKQCSTYKDGTGKL